MSHRLTVLLAVASLACGTVTIDSQGSGGSDGGAVSSSDSGASVSTSVQASSSSATSTGGLEPLVPCGGFSDTFDDPVLDPSHWLGGEGTTVSQGMLFLRGETHAFVKSPIDARQGCIAVVGIVDAPQTFRISSYDLDGHGLAIRIEGEEIFWFATGQSGSVITSTADALGIVYHSGWGRTVYHDLEGWHVNGELSADLLSGPPNLTLTTHDQSGELPPVRLADYGIGSITPADL